MNLIESFKIISPVSGIEEKLINSAFETKKYNRGATLLNLGEVARKVYFIEKGAVRQFYLDDFGNERICNLSFEGEFITNLESFSQKTPSSTWLETIEKTECREISCDVMMQLMKDSPAANLFFHHIVEAVAMENISRVRKLLSDSPENQYKHILENNPELLQRVPQKFIAQYLGIAPESLSRIRKRMQNS